MAQVLAILQGKGTAESLGLTHDFIKSHYDEAMQAYLNHYVAYKTRTRGWIAIEHKPTWNRRTGRNVVK